MKWLRDAVERANLDGLTGWPKRKREQRAALVALLHELRRRRNDARPPPVSPSEELAQTRRERDQALRSLAGVRDVLVDARAASQHWARESDALMARLVASQIAIRDAIGHLEAEEITGAPRKAAVETLRAALHRSEQPAGGPRGLATEEPRFLLNQRVQVRQVFEHVVSGHGGSRSFCRIGARGVVAKIDGDRYCVQHRDAPTSAWYLADELELIVDVGHGG